VRALTPLKGETDAIANSLVRLLSPGHG
jgi:hypothetical protein